MEARLKRCRGEKIVSFWGGENCEYCEGSISEKRVDVTRKVKGQYVLVKNVPAGVCKECGTRYYAANVLKALKETVNGRQKADREIVMPVYSL
jgi:YgiT-type zinc finger domain-containing protein